MNKNSNRTRLIILISAIVVTLILIGVVVFVSMNSGDPMIMAPGDPTETGTDNPLIM